MLRKRCAKREHVGSRATLKRARTSFKRNVVKNVKSSCLEDSEPSYLDGEADIYQRVFSSESEISLVPNLYSHIYLTILDSILYWNCGRMFRKRYLFRG